MNVAARLQAECSPGGVCVSRSVRDHVHGRLDFVFAEPGALKLKYITRPDEAFAVQMIDAEAVQIARSGMQHSALQLDLQQLRRKRRAASGEATPRSPSPIVSDNSTAVLNIISVSGALAPLPRAIEAMTRRPGILH